MVKTNYLALSWSVSRGRDTYGYNIARLDDRATDNRFKCMGGGYDMIGTCVARWLSAEYQDRLLSAGQDVTGLYGARRVEFTSKPHAIQLDGACGLECMIRIAEVIGVSISRNSNKRGVAQGFMVTDYGSGEELQAAKHPKSGAN